MGQEGVGGSGGRNGRRGEGKLQSGCKINEKIIDKKITNQHKCALTSGR